MFAPSLIVLGIYLIYREIKVNSNDKVTLSEPEAQVISNTPVRVAETHWE